MAGRLQEMEAAVRPEGDDHCPVTRLVCLENTHGKRGGRVLSAEYTVTEYKHAAR